MVRSQRGSHKGVALLLALLLCGAVSALHKQIERRQGHDKAVGAVRDAALVPGQTALVRVSRWWRIHVSSLFIGPKLAQQNRDLQNQITLLTAENRQLLAAQAENNRLRELLEFQRHAATPLLACEVTALKPINLQDTMVLNRGTADGVKLRSIALASNGALVGQVLDVSPHSCTVLMITDNNSSVGALVEPAAKGSAAVDSSPPSSLKLSLPTSKAGANAGVCQGQGSGRLRLAYLPIDTPLATGASIVSSGLGGSFPAMLPVGTVTSVTIDRTRSLKSAIIRPAADLDHLDEAFLVR